MCFCQLKVLINFIAPLCTSPFLASPNLGRLSKVMMVNALVIIFNASDNVYVIIISALFSALIMCFIARIIVLQCILCFDKIVIVCFLVCLSGRLGRP